MRPRQDGSELSDGNEGDVGHEIIGQFVQCHIVHNVWVPNCPSACYDDNGNLCQKSREDEPIESVEEFQFRTPWLYCRLRQQALSHYK